MKPARRKTFHQELKFLMDEYTHLIYHLTRKFPKEEMFGIVSQLRRATLSVILNYIEGYARNTDKSNLSFARISYGSLKESKYLLHFSMVEKFIIKDDYEKAIALADQIGAMLWGMINNEKK